MADLDSWITGFVDGEGCFSIAINPHPDMKLGFQVQAEFAVTQSASSLEALELIRSRFGCGQIQRNLRDDNHTEDLLIFRIRKFEDITRLVIPFFQTHPLRTAKRQQFDLFVRAVGLMQEKAHLSAEGLEQIRRIAQQMNQRAKRLRSSQESSETARQASPPSRGRLKVQSELHGDMQRPAEMPGPPGFGRV